MTKNILYIADTGRIIGGGEISLLNLLENLDKERFRAIVCIPDEGDWSARIRDMGIPVHLFTYRKVMNPCNLAATMRAVRILRGIIRQENIDLVHTNSTGGIVVLAGLACRLEKKPLISHIRLVYSGFLQDIAQGLLSTKIIIISRRIGRKISFMFFQRKLALVYNGVNLARFMPAAAKTDLRKDLGIPENVFLAGAAGSYVPGKGFESLIKAAGVLKPQFPDMKLIVVGFQPAERTAYIQRLTKIAADAGVSDTIRFLGRCDDMPAFFKAIDVFLFPSFIDPFGRVLIEAMACAKPAVSFATGGALEIIADNITGFLVRPGDFKGLAEKTAALFNDRQTAARFGKNSYERCVQLFSITQHAQAVQKLYREALQDGSLGYIRCPICSTSGYSVINSCTISKADAEIEEDVLHVCRCRKCGLVYVNPQPQVLERRPAELYTREYFRKGYMKFYGDENDSARAVQSNEPFSFRLDLIGRFKNAGRLLDIGCASGEFLNAARDRGFRVTGIDISSYASSIAKDKFGLDVRNTDLHEACFEPHSFDVITAGDVLEHIRDPLAFLNEIRRILKPDGILYLAVPDFGSLHYRVMSFVARFNHRNYFVLPHHIFHFTAKTLEKLLRKAGFVKLEAISTESSIQERGCKRIFMLMLFGIGRLLHMKDRAVMVAARSKEGPVVNT